LGDAIILTYTIPGAAGARWRKTLFAPPLTSLPNGAAMSRSQGNYFDCAGRDERFAWGFRRINGGMGRSAFAGDGGASYS
jgi:hypothetical protein